MHDQGEGSDHCKQHPQGPGKDIHRILAGASPAVSEGIGDFNGFYAVDAQDCLDQEEPENQPETAENAFRQQKNALPCPLDPGKTAAKNQADHTDSNAGDSYAGMPSLRVVSHVYKGKWQELWMIQCPNCGRGGLEQYESAYHALKDWNEIVKTCRFHEKVERGEASLFEEVTEED